MEIRILTRETVAALADMPEAIALMKKAFAELSAGTAIVPQRIHMDLPALNALSLVMPAYAPAAGHIGIKTISMFHDNPGREMPFIQGLMQVLDGENGRPRALMDAALLTAIRTGAASGAATDLMARPDARIAALVGPGTQGVWQLQAVCRVRSIEKVLVLGRSRDKTAAFCRDMADQLGIPVEALSGPARLREADIVCTATTSETPVFEDGDIAPGTHLNGVGSYKAHMQEIPLETVRRARVIVDNREAVQKEGGDLALPISRGELTADHIRGELGEVVLGKVPGRQTSEQVTFFKSVGNAVQDCVLAAALMQKAEDRDLGARVAL